MVRTGARTDAWSGRRAGGTALRTGTTLCAGALALAACTAPTPTGTASATTPATQEPVTVTVAAYAFAGTTYDLLAEFDREHPGIVVEVEEDAASSSTRTPLAELLRSEADLPDVVAYDESSAPIVHTFADRLVDLAEHGLADRADDVPGWALAHGTDATGRLVGLPLEIGPEALCFRRDLLADAGIAQDRDDLAAALAAAGGGWDAYLELGRRYHAATGRAWFDSAQSVWDAMVRQLPTGYTTPDGTPSVAGDTELRSRWDLLAAAVADGLSAGEAPWDWRGGAGFVDGAFATLPCSSWMTGVVADNLAAAGGGPATGWDVADVFPGGAGAWGTALVAVTADAEHPEAAAAVVEWMTRPEQQLRAYTAGGPLPSTRSGLEDVVAAGRPSDVFAGAPLEAVFAARAEGVPPHVAGPRDAEIGGVAFGTALRELEAGALDAEAAWRQAVDAMRELLEE